MKIIIPDNMFMKMCQEHGISEPEYFQKFECVARRDSILIVWAEWILTFKTEEGYTQFLLTYGEYLK